MKIGKVKINVTQDDIDKGQINNCNLCPIALAIKRILKINSYNTIFVSSVIKLLRYWNMEIQKYEVISPRSVKRFIQRFDQGKSVKPFNFFLTVPDADTLKNFR